MKRALLAAVVLSGCADDPAPTTMSVAVPQALVDCAQPPADTDLRARLWVSGTDAPCPLTILASGVSGDCVVVPGIERIFTLDWFVVVDGVDVVLAQARKSLDLGGEVEANVALVFADDDYVVAGCRDMSVDSLDGAGSVDVDGVARPVCDLDDDGTANLDEVCAGGDPLGRP